MTPTIQPQHLFWNSLHFLNSKILQFLDSKILTPPPIAHRAHVGEIGFSIKGHNLGHYNTGKISQKIVDTLPQRAYVFCELFFCKNTDNSSEVQLHITLKLEKMFLEYILQSIGEKN